PPAPRVARLDAERAWDDGCHALPHGLSAVPRSGLGAGRGRLSLRGAADRLSSERTASRRPRWTNRAPPGADRGYRAARTGLPGIRPAEIRLHGSSPLVLGGRRPSVSTLDSAALAGALVWIGWEACRLPALHARRPSAREPAGG